MNLKMVRYFLGIILLLEAVLLLFPMLVSLIYGESVMPFVWTILAILILAVPSFAFKPQKTKIYAREGFVCVAAAWLLMSLFGALPFVFSQAIPNYVDALFETVSGFTTTGASILTEIEGLPKGILFWRSFTHWIGGMGVLVFILAVIPSSEGQTIHLLRAEVPGPVKGKLVPKIRHTALILYGIYVVMTFVEIIALIISGLGIYDSVVTTFATAGTGGFSVMNESIKGYGNVAAEWIIAVFMMLFGVNFNMYFFLLIKRGREVLKNEELRIYLLICFASTALIVVNLWNTFSSFGENVRIAYFQTMSFLSTTGFYTADTNTWPAFSKAVLLLLMIVGGCAGSTGGGVKVSRILILIKSAVRDIKQMIRPKSVEVVRMDGEMVSEETVTAAKNYLTIYLCIFILSSILISTDGFDFETNTTASLTCLSNVGPGFGAIIGSTGNFSTFSWFSKIVLSLDMLFGRLEIMPMVILFAPATWKKR